MIILDLIIGLKNQGIARTQSPTITNSAPESPTFGVIARFSQTESAMERPLCQVSMLAPAAVHKFSIGLNHIYGWCVC